MSITENLRLINAWLSENGVSIDEKPAPADPDQLSKLKSMYPQGSISEIDEFYRQQNGFPNWFVLYSTWQLMSLEEALTAKEILKISSTHVGHDDQWQPFWFPILTNNGGDYVFKNINTGEIEFYDHTDGEKILISRNLDYFLKMLAEDINQHEYVFEGDEPSYRGQRVIGHG
ncbi:SMI1/KNR4 family protein [Deinococcus sp.]|uniref:SMI1/KNR4 family protein n=1 Tax=Deinococcus sp. TaxID=47478 RepID=UPI00391A16F5